MYKRSKEDIEIDFARAISQAQELEEIACELSRIATAHVEGALAMLEKNWKGDNAGRFGDKSRVLSTQMLETADDLLKVSRSIKSTADIVYRAEKAAIQICY